MRIALALLALTFLPGLPLAALFLRRLRDGTGWLAAAGTLGMLWSVLATLGLTLAHLPLTVFSVAAHSSLPLLIVAFWPPFRRTAGATLRGISLTPVATLLVSVTIVVLSLPILTVQRGLPTGDVQKSIFWAERIRATDRPPDYDEALAFNRDPEDFSIPGLHSLTAAVSELSGDPLRGPAWFSLLAAILLAGLAASLAALLSSSSYHLSTLAFVMAATNVRFLRYAQAPGYHYQNLIGELFLLLALLFLLQAVGGRGGMRFVALAGLTAAVLPLVHQFTAFLALLMLPAVFVTLLVKYRREIFTLLSTLSLARRRTLLGATLIAAVATLAALARGPLINKLPHLLSTAPHLSSSVISPWFIPVLLGAPFFFLGAVGALIAVIRVLKRDLEWRFLLLLLWVGLLLALSQGARFFLDIPSARTLFYVAIPLAVLAALAASSAVERIASLWPRAAGSLVPLALALLLAPTAGASLNERLQSIDVRLQSNSTLTHATLELLAWLKEHPPLCVNESAPARCADALLIDDWNQRRTTWTILSPYRMLTRVGPDLAVIAREAGQSDQRRTQYETLLDFEKIYALGNSPDIIPLLERHGIAFLVGVNGLSRDVFVNNPALEVAYENLEVTLFVLRDEERTRHSPSGSAAEDAVLLDRTTLANDVGDAEDIFASLPVSLLAPRISDTKLEKRRTFRDIESAVSSIGLNVGAFVPNLWDADGDRVVDAQVELVLHAAGNGVKGRIAKGSTVFSEFSLPSDGETHAIRARFPAGELSIDEQGLALVTLRLDDGPLRLDLVSARLAPYTIQP